MPSTNISPEVSKRICKHMNEDHGVSVYAMVCSTLSGAEKAKTKISNWKMNSVSNTDISLSYVACDSVQGLCMPSESTIKFDPPLSSPSQAKARLMKLHDEVLSPKFTWLITDATSRLIFPTVLALGYFTYVGFEQFLQDFENQASVSLINIVNTVFGSPEGLFTCVRTAFIFSVVAHLTEAIYVVYQCRKKLSLKPTTTLSWFLIVSVVGFPMTSKVLEFVNVKNQNQSGKKKD
mmetsp:Transcript_14795/g.18029  ORF Transcript_14795/g.18029 Transcript_14795/m.18029 type:complete len:235 (+) Transcript_14795:135-839(+)